MAHQLEAVVQGRVQGVGFRYYTKKLAEKYGLVGVARNQTDGTVKIVAQGERKILQLFLQRLHKDGGPRWAVVDQIDVSWDEAKTRYQGFSIK